MLRTPRQHLEHIYRHQKHLQGPIMLRCHPSYGLNAGLWLQLLADLDKSILTLRAAYDAYDEVEAYDRQLIADNPGMDRWELAALSEENAQPCYRLIEQAIQQWADLLKAYFALLQQSQTTLAA